MNLSQNVGNSDKNIRYTVAVIAIVLSAFLTGSFSTFIFAIGVVAFATAYFGYCGLYQVLGINTCPMKKITPLKSKKVAKKSMQAKSKR